ncbi:MAG: O-antigen ligase family protein [Nitrospirae bacterium]|jgi:O-antigen ligase|nr:O-antigen ligase family protein [Nitrospirota bacterium]
MDRPDNSYSKIIYIILSIIIFSALSFGAVEIWSSSIAGIFILTLFVIWIIISCRKDSEFADCNIRKISFDDVKIIAAICALPLYAFIQILPLPEQILKIISPKAYELYTFYSLTKSSFIPISLNPYRTISNIQQILYSIAVFIPVYFLARDRLSIERSIKILSVFGFILAFFALIQMATWNGKIYWLREVTSGSPFGPFVNRNHYAGFIDMLIPATLGIAFIRKSKEKQILFGFFAVIMTVSVFMSLSRAGIISFIISITVFSAFIVNEKFRHNKKIALLIFIMVLSSYLIYLGVDPVIERFYRTDLTTEERFTIWTDTCKGAKEFILTGSGLGTFVNVFPVYSSKPSTVIYDHAHNDYVEFLFEAGIAGIILLAIFLYFYIIHCLKGIWRGELGIIRISLVSSVMTIIVHSIFDFNLHITSNLLLLAFIMAILAASSKIEPHDIECHALSVNQNKNEENFVNYANYENSKELI